MVPLFKFSVYSSFVTDVKTLSSTDLAYHKSGSLMSKYVVCELFK